MKAELDLDIRQKTFASSVLPLDAIVANEEPIRQELRDVAH